jgi:hypothetical protein
MEPRTIECTPDAVLNVSNQAFSWFSDAQQLAAHTYQLAVFASACAALMGYFGVTSPGADAQM